eukprot:TRINITY_DN2884_c0_g1_i8.p1 TRINITY_DN2884_c0_g1~~TRINITY_DN2884_c0_g1_i8.p1  ORF type:complete len:556 (-),score=76.39 TRINITY_DN2884_c0_g1_i8:165-1832(-)
MSRKNGHNKTHTNETSPIKVETETSIEGLEGLCLESLQVSVRTKVTARDRTWEQTTSNQAEKERLKQSRSPRDRRDKRSVRSNSIQDHLKPRSKSQPVLFMEIKREEEEIVPPKPIDEPLQRPKRKGSFLRKMEMEWTRSEEALGKPTTNKLPKYLRGYQSDEVCVEGKGDDVILESIAPMVIVEVLTGGRYIDYDNFLEDLTHTFLLTYRLFSNPMDVLSQLKERFEKTSNPTVLKIIKIWIKLEGDLMDDVWVAKLQQFSSLVKSRPSLRGERFVTFVEEFSKQSSTGLAEVQIPLTTGFSVYNPPWLLIEPMEIAKQITLSDVIIFDRITLVDVLQYDSDQSVLKLCSQRFNRMSQLITHTILFQKDNSTRVELIGSFISVANALFMMKNFHSFVSVISALQQNSICRLTDLWKQVPTKFISEYDKMVSVCSSFPKMPQLRRIIEISKPPYIPFTGTTVGDLSMISEVPTQEDGLINFQKCNTISKIIGLVLNSQCHDYLLELRPISLIQDFLNYHFQSLVDEDHVNQFHQQSLVIQPSKRQRSCRLGKSLV